MQMMTFNFLMYTASGCWRPIEWISNPLKLLYNLLSCIIMGAYVFWMFMQFMDIILVAEDADDFIAGVFMLVSVANVALKGITALWRRERIIGLIKILQERPCMALNEEEITIRARNDYFIRSTSINYSLLASCSVTGLAAACVLNIMQGRLPFKVWIPYDEATPVFFWLVSVQQFLGLFLATALNIATETLVFGFCLQTCAQLDILKYRLQNMIRRSEIDSTRGSPSNGTWRRASKISEHVCHHLCIIKFAQLTNEVFNEVLFAQFFVSILVVCASLYHISSHMNIVDVGTMAIFTFCMSVQVFVYCWAGNEVILKSAELSEAIYGTNWILMTTSERRDLLMIMRRTTRPIKYTSSFLVTLSLESYSNILKTTYTAFNVLQQS